jgi:GcrA cell cycle regulator
MEWDQAAIDTLTALWAEGLSTTEIARRMRISKNAVCGKVHRLGLTSRPSPIRRDGISQPRRLKPRRAPRITLAPLNHMPPVQQAASTTSGGGGDLLDPVKRVGPSVPPLESAHFPAALGRAAPPCCWIVGDTSRRDYRTCDAPQDFNHQTGKFRVYCAEHCAKAYVRAEKIDTSAFVAFASSR